MKEIVAVLAFIAFMSSSLGASNSSKFKVDELILLPHPGKTLKNHAKELGVTKGELERVKNEVKKVYPSIFQEKIRQAFKIEKKVRRMVAKGKTKTDVKSYLDKIERLKREAIDVRIDALNKFREILGDEKWTRVINYKDK